MSNYVQHPQAAEQQHYMPEQPQPAYHIPHPEQQYTTEHHYAQQQYDARPGQAFGAPAEQHITPPESSTVSSGNTAHALNGHGYTHGDGQFEEKQTGPNGEPLETIHTNERVGSHTNYYEKDGLRTEGDGQDHVGAHHKMSFRLWMAILAMCFLWTESQIPVYFFGGVPPEIYGDIGGVDRWIWMIIGNLITLAAVCPFVGAMSDLLGRRYVALAGSVLIIVGMIVCSTAKTMNTMIAGMCIAGGGAGINELTAIAGTAELVPTAKRGPIVGLVVFSILPFCPAVMYAQLITHAGDVAGGPYYQGGWRWLGLFIALWTVIGFFMTLFFYFPPKRLNSEGYSKKKILSRIDYVGAFLSIGGFVLFLAAMQWGAEQYSWASAHVLVPFVIGVVMIIAFGFWEKFGARYPMIPSRLNREPRILILTMLITFFSGSNFFCLLFFWPTQAFNVYGNDYLGVGIRGLPIGFCIIGGAVVSLVLIGVTKGRIRAIMIFFTAMMTAGNGAMAALTRNNLNTIYGILVVACLGTGGVIVPCTLIVTIICPDDLIATITALSLSVRVLGGAVGFTVYYNVFYHKVYNLAYQIVGIEAIARQLVILNVTLATQLANLAAHAQFVELRNITNGFEHTPYAYDIIVGATQIAMAKAYVWPYYISIAFGGISFICACFLGDIRKYMDDHIAAIY